jgi:archaellum component FlaC
MQGQKKVNRANKLNRGRKSVEGRPILLETPRTLRPVIRNTLFAYERYAKLRGKAIDVSINPEGPEKLIVHFTLLLPDDENQPEKQFKKRLVEGAEDDLWALLKVIQDGRAVTEKDLPVTNRILNKESAQAIRRELDRLNKEIQNIREEMSIYAKERSGLKDLKTQIHEQGQGNFIYINSFEGTLIHSNSDSSFALGDGSIATSLAESTIEGSLQVSSHTIITDIDKLVEMLQATKNSNLEFQQQIVRDIQEIQNDVKNKRAVDRSKAKKAWQKVKQFITDYAEPSLTLLRFAQQIFDVLGKAR